VWSKLENNFLINILDWLKVYAGSSPNELTKGYMDWICIAITGWKRARRISESGSSQKR
jgi:hypothetical protein